MTEDWNAWKGIKETLLTSLSWYLNPPSSKTSVSVKQKRRNTRRGFTKREDSKVREARETEKGLRRVISSFWYLNP